MKKLTSLLLATLLLLSVCAGCANDTPGDDTTAPQDTTAPVETTTEETTTVITPDIPADKKYDGFEFKILTSDEVNTIRSSFEIEAEDDGDVMNAAVYKRNLQMSESLGVTVKQLKGVYKSTGWIKDFRNAVTAGDQAYDILVAAQNQIIADGPKYGAEVSDLPYVDLEKPWWDNLLLSGTAIAGKTFGLAGDLNLVDDSATWANMFNKDLGEQYGVKANDLYQLVRDGKWTVDKFQEVTSKVNADVNGDGVREYTSDIFGNVTSGNAIAAMLWASGGSYGYLDQDGKPVITLDTEKNMTVLNRLFDILADNNVNITNLDTNKDYNLQRSVFQEGRSFFIQGTVSYIPLYLREVEFEFGVLPNPKWDENQADYIATAQEWAGNFWMAPRNGEDLERTSIILEQMCYLSGDTIVPAYYDHLLTRKTVRDEQSVEMLQIIFDARTVYDLPVASNWGKVRNIATALDSESNTLASTIAGMKESAVTAAQKSYDDTVAATAEAK